jgi:DNA mismatch repair protein MSH6
MAKLTLFDQQFYAIKSRRADLILLYQAGSFYELYGLDCHAASKVLGLKVSSSRNGLMSGFPLHSLRPFAARLLAAGYNVGVVEQVESAAAMQAEQRLAGGSPRPSNRVVRRELTQVLTLATLADPLLCPSDDPHHLAVVYVATAHERQPLGAILLDVAAGLVEAVAADTRAGLARFLRRGRPRETIFIVQAGSNALLARDAHEAATAATDAGVLRTAPSSEAPDAAKMTHVKFADERVLPWVSQLAEPTRRALGAALHHLDRVLALEGFAACCRPAHCVSAGPTDFSDPIYLSAEAVDALGILPVPGRAREVGTLASLGADGTVNDVSLFSLLRPHLLTPMGVREARQLLTAPPKAPAAVAERQAATIALVDLPATRSALASALKGTPDLERLLSRARSGQASAREMRAVLSSTIRLATAIPQALAECGRESALLTSLAALPSLAAAASHASSWSALLGPAPPPAPGSSAKTDSENVFAIAASALDADGAVPDAIFGPTCPISREELTTASQQLLAAEADLALSISTLEARLEEASETTAVPLTYTHIGKLRFQITVPARHKPRVPKDWELTSQTKQVFRYHAPWSGTLCDRLAIAEASADAARNTCRRLFSRAFSATEALAAVARAVAVLDTLRAGACLSAQPGWVRPILLTASLDGAQTRTRLVAKGLRHPNFPSSWVPNDVSLGAGGPATALISGCNSGGKTNILRVVGLATVLTHAGLFVPAEEFAVTPVDSIRVRFAVDMATVGEASSWQREAAEISSVLDGATARSLLLLDELGHSTGGHDGACVAEAVVARVLELGAPTIVATHFAHLAVLFNGPARVGHMSATVDDATGDIAYHFKLLDSPSPHSFGPEAAAKAGVPRDVVLRAKQLAFELQSGDMPASLIAAARRAVCASDPSSLLAAQRLAAALTKSG